LNKITNLANDYPKQKPSNLFYTKITVNPIGNIGYKIFLWYWFCMRL